jgi:DNA-binding LacI/PurR family transcriptional regulator
LVSVNQREIAKALGITQAAVSIALAGKPGVSEQLRRKVKEICNELGYCPNYAALSLSGRETRTISVITEGMMVAEGLSRFIGFLNRETNNQGYKFRLDQLNAVEQIVAERSADGLIFLDNSDGYEMNIRRAGQMPCVYGGGVSLKPMANSVPMDNFGGTRDAIRHLISLGHKKIAFIGLVELWPLCRERHLGYMSAMESAGYARYAQEKGTVIRVPNWISDADEVTAYTDRIFSLLNSGTTAFFCSNDIAAIGLIRIMLSTGLSVPNDVSVVGFDDTVIARSWMPPLTTVRIDNELAAETAVRMVINQIRTSTRSPGIVIPTKLVIRRTTAEPKYT